MNRFYIIPFFTFILCFHSGFSQKAPGYLGKRFSLEYNAFVFPSFTNPNSEDATPKDPSDYYNYKQKGVSLNLQHHFVALWVVSKKISITGSYGFAKTNYVPTLSQYIYFNDYPSMRGQSLQGGFRVFIDHFAPLGKYWELKGGLTVINTDEFTYKYGSSERYNPNSPSLKEVKVEGAKAYVPSVAFSFGTNRIVNDFILLSYGLDVNVLIGGSGYHVSLAQNASYEQFDPGFAADNKSTLLNMATARYALHCAINLKVGIGVLL